MIEDEEVHSWWQENLERTWRPVTEIRGDINVRPRVFRADGTAAVQVAKPRPACRRTATDAAITAAPSMSMRSVSQIRTGGVTSVGALPRRQYGYRMADDFDAFGAEARDLLAARGPLPLEALAELIGTRPDVLCQALKDHPHVLSAPDGTWVSGLRLADGVAAFRASTLPT